MTITKLTRTAPLGAGGEAPAKVTPKGWGKPESDASQSDNGQRERIAAQLQDATPAAQARSAFSGGVQQQIKQLEAPAGEADKVAKEVDDAADGKAKRTRTRRAADPQAEQDLSHNALKFSAERVSILQLIFTSPAFEGVESVEQGLEIAEQLRAFVEG